MEIAATRDDKVTRWLEFCRMVAGGAFVGCLVGGMMPWPEATNIATILGALVCSYIFFPAEGG